MKVDWSILHFSTWPIKVNKSDHFGAVTDSVQVHWSSLTIQSKQRSCWMLLWEPEASASSSDSDFWGKAGRMLGTREVVWILWRRAGATAGCYGRRNSILCVGCGLGASFHLWLEEWSTCTIQHVLKRKACPEQTGRQIGLYKQAWRSDQTLFGQFGALVLSLFICFPARSSLNLIFPFQDFLIMFVHHLATIGLITFSYMNNMVRVGTLVLCLHDASDFLLEVSEPPVSLPELWASVEGVWTEAAG